MKKLILSAAIVPLFSFAAYAADLPNTKGPPTFAPPPPPVFSWTGFYAGLNAGFDWANDPISLTPGGLWNTAFDAGNSPFIAANGSPTLHPSGFAGGGQIGFNYQIQNFVLGIEGDIDYTDLHSSLTTGTLTAPLFGETFVFQSAVRSNWLSTVRARLGFTPFDRLLVYGTGGLALGQFTFTNGYLFGPAPLVSVGTSTRTAVGWTVGGGVEYALTPNWTVKGEYLYADLGHGSSFTTAETFGGVANGYTSYHQARLTENLARIGINYKFDMFAPAGPVMQKY